MSKKKRYIMYLILFIIVLTIGYLTSSPVEPVDYELMHAKNVFRQMQEDAAKADGN